MYNLGAAFFGFRQPLKGYGMILRRVAPLDQYDITMLQVNPMIRHRTTSERL
jgi:hypothetical protein